MSPTLPVCLLGDILLLFFSSPPVSLLSRQKYIPVHSLCCSLLLPCPFFSGHVAQQTHGLSFCLYSLWATLQLYIELVPPWEAHLLNVMDFLCLVVKSSYYLPTSTALQGFTVCATTNNNFFLERIKPFKTCSQHIHHISDVVVSVSVRFYRKILTVSSFCLFRKHMY